MFWKTREEREKEDKEKQRIEERRRLEEESKQREGEEAERQFNDFASKYLLTISASEYVSAKGKRLEDYDFRSVDSFYVGHRNGERTVHECKKRMIEKAQQLEAEVIIDVKPSIAYHEYHYQPFYLIGTALIQKQR